MHAVLLGSVSERVLYTAPCLVLIVRPAGMRAVSARRSTAGQATVPSGGRPCQVDDESVTMHELCGPLRSSARQINNRYRTERPSGQHRC